MTGNEFHGIHRFFSEISIPLTVLFVAPFVLLLLSIAVLPLLVPHFWEKNRNKALVSLVCGLPVAVFFIYKDWNALARTALEYGAFITLLGALFVISGGIYIKGSFKDTPAMNTAFLAAGAFLANIIGTTGASMLLIRPLIGANRDRRYKSHIIIFFIFLVSNCAGLLTPLGDPPLFLGFIKGVSFGWTFRLLPEFLFITGALLLIFYAADSYFLSREVPELRRKALKEEWHVPTRFGIEGKRNFVFFAAVIGVSLFSGYELYPLKGPDIFNEPFGAVAAELFEMAGFTLLAVAAYRSTPGRIRGYNNFNFHPIVEVAVMFAGIFAAMIPALLILETKGAGFGIDRPWQFFWLTGSLSSFLDNAPTYLTFTSLAKGVLGITGEGLRVLSEHPVGQQYLAAISCGAVFMGANTYIGNGPNFMVKSIAENQKVKMPSFFGYMAWSVCILLPLFAAVTFLFF